MRYIILLIEILLCHIPNLASAQDFKYTPQYADLCYLKGISEFNNQNYQTAKYQFEQSLEVNDSIKRDEPYLSSNAINWISHILYIEGNKKEAQDLTVDYCFLPVDQRNTQESDSLWILSSECSDIKQSLHYSKMARNIEITNLGNNHYYIANSDQEIANIYMKLGQWDSAKYYQKEAIEIFERCMSNDFTQNYIITLLQYTRTCVQLCDINAYEIIAKKCKFAAQQLYGKISYDYASSLYILSEVNYDFRDYVDCISNAKEAAKIYSQLFPSEKYEMDLAICYRLLGNVYGHINNYQEALSYLQLASDIFEKRKSIGDGILFDLAFYQGKNGYFDEALKNYKKLINLLETHYLPNQSEKKQSQDLLISSYLDVAEIFYRRKDIDSTILYANRGLDLAKKYDARSKQLEALQDLSACYFDQSLYNKAIELQEYILREDSSNMTNISNLMCSYYMVKNKDGLYKCASLYYVLEKKRIISEISKIYETARFDYLENGEFKKFDYPIKFAEYYNMDDSICSLAYNCELFKKGLLLTSSIDFSRIISECSETIQNEYAYLLQIRERLNHPIPNQERYKLVELEQKIEGNLLKQIPRWTDNIKQLQVTWKDVQKALNKNEVAIEFSKIKSGDNMHMIALIIRAGWNSPRCIVLDELDYSDNMIGKFNQTTFSDHMLSKRIWTKILNEAQILDHETIFFAADGAFRVFPIEYLCNPQNPNQTISDCFDIIRLSSTRDICTRKDSDYISSISLYGNLLYNIPKEKKIANSRIYKPSKYCDLDNAQSPFMNDSTRSGFKYLYWTKAEIDSIEQYSMNYLPQTSVLKYELDKGTEESFKRMSSKATSIIHMATHAFYYSKESSNHLEGILLSGCNTICDDSLEVEDGILCSSEIELLDLRNTSLVVLSGCKTGLGNSMVDGIGGLQRAFKKAGVNTIIMSLWEVSDIATSYFMSNFYKFLFVTKSKKKAFIKAQQLTKSKFDSPYYWASFVMLD